MTADEQQVRIAARLYEMRDKARRLLGERYSARMKELGEILIGLAKKRGLSPLSFAIETCKKREAEPLNVMLILSAAVELTEPTGDTKGPMGAPCSRAHTHETAT